MAINKVQYGNTVLIDLTDTTAVASDVAQGKYFYTSAGVKTAGTATGGGSAHVWQDAQGYVHLDDEGSPSVGGLVYETGTWTPSEDDSGSNLIFFSNTHNTMPFFVCLYNATDEYISTQNITHAFTYCCFDSIFGGAIWSSESTARYGDARLIYRGTNATSTSITTNNLQYPPTDIGADTGAHPRYWVNETGFRPVAGSRPWGAGITYKWIAIWTPTT